MADYTSLRIQKRAGGRTLTDFVFRRLPKAGKPKQNSASEMSDFSLEDAVLLLDNVYYGPGTLDDPDIVAALDRLQAHPAGSRFLRIYAMMPQSAKRRFTATAKLPKKLSKEAIKAHLNRFLDFIASYPKEASAYLEASFLDRLEGSARGRRLLSICGERPRVKSAQWLDPKIALGLAALLGLTGLYMNRRYFTKPKQKSISGPDGFFGPKDFPLDDAVGLLESIHEDRRLLKDPDVIAALEMYQSYPLGAKLMDAFGVRLKPKKHVKTAKSPRKLSNEATKNQLLPGFYRLSKGGFRIRRTFPSSIVRNVPMTVIIA